MKNLLLLATMLLTFDFTNAQCKIYSTSEYGGSARQIGKIENGKYGGSARQVGKIDGGKVYSTSEYGGSARQIGKYDGGSACGAASAFILLL